MKADRMIAILLYLQNEGKLSAKELAERLEVSERTIIRDMEALSVSGIPVYAERGSNGGWMLAEGYRTKLTGMKNEELTALVISAQSNLLRDLGIEDHFAMARQKLLAAAPSDLKRSAELIQRKIHIDGAGWYEANEACPFLSVIQEAVLAETQLCIHYKKERDIVVRTLQPLGLVAKRSVWYLVGSADGSIRTYRVTRIVYAQLLEEKLPFPGQFDLAEYWEESTRQFKRALPHYIVKVRLKAPVLARIEQERFIAIRQTADCPMTGWIAAELDVATLEYGCETLLKFGADLEVIEPPELRLRLRQTAEAVSRLYRP